MRLFQAPSSSPFSPSREWYPLHGASPVNRAGNGHDGLGPDGDRLPLAPRIADPRNLTSGRTFLGPDHDPAYAGGGGSRGDGTLLVRRRSDALDTSGRT